MVDKARVAAVSDFFPHEHIRPGQEELIQDLDSAIQNKKILIAHAPTGMGKTASALYVTLKYALKEKKKVFFLTNRHTQHRIAVETLKMMQKKSKENLLCVDLIGKKWMCNQDVAGLFGNEFNEYCKSITQKEECEFLINVKNQKKELTVEARLHLQKLRAKGPLHNVELINYCKEQGMCSYEMAVLLAKDAQVLIGDYNYLFNPYVAKHTLSRMNLEPEDIILILDEGHNLPGRVVEMLSAILTNHMLKNAIYEAKKFHFNGVIAWMQELNRILLELGDFSKLNENEKKVTKDDFLSRVKMVCDYDRMVEEMEFAADEVRRKQRKSYIGGVSAFLASWGGSDEGFVRYISKRYGKYGEVLALNYACLDPRLVTKDIFTHIHSGIVMSGTLKPTFMYKDVLGIDERAMEKEYASPFPTENKLSIVIPETTTKYTARNELMFQKIGEKCSELSKLIPGNLAFFFPSYDLQGKIGEFVRTPKKIFWENSEMNKEEKDVLLEQFKKEKETGAVLLGVAGANFAEGIDLPGDLLNGVVVVGLPLAKPDLLTKEIIAYFDQKFNKGWNYGYIYPAMNKCLQSAGRCIRSETDRGVIIYLDERFTWSTYFGCFPKEGLRVSKDYARLLEEFFGK